RLEPAGTDKGNRYALLRGEIRLAKGNDKESAFEGTLQLVVTYRLDGPEVRSVRGVIEGDFVYRTQGGKRLPLRAAIESRPDSPDPSAAGRVSTAARLRWPHGEQRFSSWRQAVQLGCGGPPSVTDGPRQTNMAGRRQLQRLVELPRCSRRETTRR